MNINWYPGHMAKAKKSLTENLFLIDIIIELVDARIPVSSKNPDIKNLAPSKFKVLLLNKSDLADPEITKKFIELLKKNNYNCLDIDCLTKKNFDKLNNLINKFALDKKQRLKSRGRIFSPVRIMVVGIPNVGKSSFINKFVNKKIAKTADKPGVTLSKQWIKINKDIELLDTPGILWPKLNNKAIALNLAFTGAIKNNNLDLYDLALKLIDRLNLINPDILLKRYNAKKDIASNQIKLIAKNRGFIKKSGELDLERAAIILLDEFKSGKLGKITLENYVLENNIML